MATHQEPCNICGCKVYDLHDGFFYCTECGTQDVRAQEAVFEYNMKEDGTNFRGKVQKLNKKFKRPEERMPNQWYRWHTMNFVLFNTADELIDLGANPSFKKKLLWIWTKYLKTYVKRSHLGLSEKEEDILKPEVNTESDTTDSDEEKFHNMLNRFEKMRFKKLEVHASAILAMIYVALNIDSSHIQLSHLIRYIKEHRISFPHHIEKIVPKDLLVDKKYLTFNFDNYSHKNLRRRAMALCKKLNLGCPIVPDLRLIVEEYIEELCLPHDFKHFVFSLMEYHSCNFLDILVTEKDLSGIPHYELHCMTYILWGLKLCFGLDCDYELKLSTAVDKINEQENYPKAYFDSPPNSTERLFSFREWCGYIHFRKTILHKHCRYFRHQAGLDIDSYVSIEQFENLSEANANNLVEEISSEITQRIPGGNPPYGIVPENEFIPSTTPYSTYARVIANHLQDPDVKLALSEDFTQYSMKYITEDVYLVDLDDEEQTNLVTGITIDNKDVKSTEMDIEGLVEFKKNMVYVRDCDNHNWLSTNSPEAVHLIKLEPMETDVNTSLKGKNDNKKRQTDDKLVNDTLDDENIHCKTIEDKSIEFDDIKTDKKDFSYSSLTKQYHFGTITEENDNVNIFDDDFITLNETKIEIPDKEIELSNNNLPFEPDFTQSNIFSEMNNEEPVEEDAQSSSSLDSLDFDPSTFDRERIIKELVLMKCKKYSIAIPPRYKPHQVRTYNRRPRTCTRRSFKAIQNKKGTLEGLLDQYYANAELDPLQQIHSDVHNTMNKISEIQKEMDVNEPFNSSINNLNESLPQPRSDDDIPLKLDIEEDLDKTKVEKEDESDSDDKLFDESSDGETYGAEFIPPKNPKYDEEKYDKKQLYLKVKKPQIPDMEIDDGLSHIIETKMEKDAKDPSLLEWKNERVRAKSESDDDIPLSEIRRQNELYKKVREQSKMTLPPFFEGKTVKDFKYWFNFYSRNFTKNKTILGKHRTETDMSIYYTKSFKFVIEICAAIVGCEVSHLLIALANCEQIVLSKCKIKVKRNKNIKFILNI